MKLYSTDRGIARAATDGQLELLDLPAPDLGAQLLVDPGLDAVRQAGISDTVDPGEVRLRAPVPRPGKVLGIGINYSSHVEEARPMLEQTGTTVPDIPIFFLAPGSAVVGPEDPVVLPAIAPDAVDYEIELAVVIGAGGVGIAEADAMSHVAGYTVSNDVSARDIQREAMGTPLFELSHAKGIDSFKPMGPCLVTADEFTDPLDIGLTTTVNGELRQDARTTELIHSVARCIARVSEFMTLEPGDVICTGSPAGIGAPQGKFLRNGDVVEMTIEGIGTLRQNIVAAP